MKRIQNLHFLFILLSFSFFLFPFSFTPPTSAQTPGACSSNPVATIVQDGLVSTPSLGNNNLVTSTGICIIDSKAAFAPYKIPSYDDLKSLYYTQAKSSATVTKYIPTNPPSGSNDVYESSVTLNDSNVLYFVNGNLIKRAGQSFGCSNCNSGVGLVFVERDLTINSNIIRRSGGFVFVVKGNVNINPSVTEINAVIISGGTICTSADFTDPANPTCPSGTVANSSQLVINGSLISLKQPPADNPTASYIRFRRSLADNTLPAEKIIHDVKYLVILRNLMSDTVQRWSEIQ